MTQNTQNNNPPEILRIKNRTDFLRLRNSGRSIAAKSVVIQFAPSTFGCNKVAIGFTATKKIGKAHTRNRAKRRLRSAIEKKHLQLQGGYDIVLIARASTVMRTWEKLIADLDNALLEAKLIKS